MISIITDKITRSVNYLKRSLDEKLIPNNLCCCEDEHGISVFLSGAVKNCRAVILCGDTVKFKEAFATTFDLTMFYDKHCEKLIESRCAETKQPVPPQYMMDRLCELPENFAHYSLSNGLQCACHGEHNKCFAFILPDNEAEVRTVFETYLFKAIEKLYALGTAKVFKIFGMSSKQAADIAEDVCSAFKGVSHKCETSASLDTRLTLMFAPKAPAKLTENVTNAVVAAYGKYLYAQHDTTLQREIVSALTRFQKTLSVAESLTGGEIASKLVEVEGASKVFNEGLVTYSIASKCKRLNISPYFVDKYGVVSNQVAHEMAVGLLKSGADFAVATTGYAGPQSDGVLPVGLCFIAIGTHNGVSVYRNIFSGTRNEIREQASNSALYLLWKNLMNM